ncbi:hypothetical protein GCM10023196_019090 [Actinoallomurus vinaceus]|uniref:HTH araC/xylS-type domain-containing protein n=1 Tax=Actinoallomurus vinaceus TaxID=1080074 RepID=A0ABP8U684_9ACTN
MTGEDPRGLPVSRIEERNIRVDHARELLETTALSIDRIAEHSGLGSAANLRHHFTRTVGVPPSAYRKAFSAR